MRLLICTQICEKDLAKGRKEGTPTECSTCRAWGAGSMDKTTVTWTEGTGKKLCRNLVFLEVSGSHAGEFTPSAWKLQGSPWVVSIKPFQQCRESLWGVVPMKEPAWRWGGANIQSIKWLWGQQDLGDVRQTSFFFFLLPLPSFFIFILFKTKTPHPTPKLSVPLWDPSNTPPKSQAIFKNDMQCILWRGHQ